METPGGTPCPQGVETHDDLITIAGGEEIEVTHLDGSKETVKVRQIPLSKLQQYILFIGVGKMADVISLYCDKPPEWADSLDQSSALAIAKKGRELNGPFATAWLEESKAWAKILAPADQAAKEPGAGKATLSPSASSQQTSPASTASPPQK